MHALRLLVAGLVVGGVVAIDAPAGYAVTDASLTVSPRQGSPRDPFTVTYRYSSHQVIGMPEVRICGEPTYRFSWDGGPNLGSASPVLDGDWCVTTLRATPPASSSLYRTVSTHTISVVGLSTTYTVTPLPSPTPAATPTRTVTRPPATSAPTPRGQASASAISTPLPAANAGSAAASESAGPAPAAVDQHPAEDTASSTGSLTAIGVLVLVAGAGAFGVLHWRTRRSTPATTAPSSPPDAVDTQPATK
ncbi:hypothetical protein [Planosporangium mesophilum]|uniref:hypothetical protein n=1 Tax=Planosporangium mesophilum TaxID=689768 RepID=UPI001438D261|nr:hypothetical protein [Planosporangium mesophilum]NJC81117.1 hypothetical protein [Planosporangium mesophilum]